jgi:hypothetical protein
MLWGVATSPKHDQNPVKLSQVVLAQILQSPQSANAQIGEGWPLPP